MCTSLYTVIVIHNTAQNSSNNLPSYPADNNHCSDVIYGMGKGKLRLHAYNCTLAHFTQPANKIYMY